MKILILSTKEIVEERYGSALRKVEQGKAVPVKDTGDA